VGERRVAGVGPGAARIGRRVTALAVGLVLPLVALLVMPRRHEVVGHSMGPALLPGDVVSSGWLPLLDGWRRPRRWERWIVVLPDGTTGLKRVVGLPGETLVIDDGDLVIDGTPVLKPPAVLAEVGSTVDAAPSVADGTTVWTRPPVEVLDDATWEPQETSRLLLPVRDVGFATLVAVGPTAARVRVRVGPFEITWRLASGGTHALVAGRLDGHLVAAAWPLPGDGAPASRACLPPGAPPHWDVERPWPDAADDRSDDLAPTLAVRVMAEGSGSAVGLRQVGLWRDLLRRPAADGRDRWVLADTECLVLGDHPSASRDSRHFGPLPLGARRHRVATARSRPPAPAGPSGAR